MAALMKHRRSISSLLLLLHNSYPIPDPNPRISNFSKFSTKSDEGKRELIEKLVENSANKEVSWEQFEKDVEAEKGWKKVSSPGFSFSAAGLLYPYHLGAAQLLLDKGYIKDTTPLAGSSAGAIVCAVVASGKSMQDALQVSKVLAEDCRIKDTAFRLGEVLRDGLNNFLPDDIHSRCNGRVRVGITRLSWRLKGLLVDQFDLKEDLINALFTSSFIPGYLAPRPATMFRNQLCVDGGADVVYATNFSFKNCPYEVIMDLYPNKL